MFKISAARKVRKRRNQIIERKLAMKIQATEHSFIIELNGRVLLSHSFEKPFIFAGYGEAQYDMYRGNFDIQDYVVERVPLRYIAVKEQQNGCVIELRKYKEEDTASLMLEAVIEEGKVKIYFREANPQINRLWIRIEADQDEKIYGCGEQLSYFNLRGKNFPLWTSEPGVGRNKNTYTTWQADVSAKAGGDYYNTNYPQPTFVSTKKYYCHLESTAYMDFDFSHEAFHELQVWDIPAYLQFEAGETYLAIIEKLTAFLGRQPKLPEWVYNGFILGIQGGTDFVIEKLEMLMEKGVPMAGLWCQDWQGLRFTSFGKRLMWDWQWDPTVYPDLDKKIHELKARGIRFMGYINPYVAAEKELYTIANERGYLAKDLKGDTYLVDFGEFYCGVVDFTNEAAAAWYKEVIKTNLIGFGLDGWMADFGEYLPTDCVLSNGVSAEIMHNAWPAIWARINYEAVKEAGKLEEVVYFMRAGFTGSQKYCTLMWAGDQSVIWEVDDGLASVIPAALSMGMTGCGLHHSDIGGYTSLLGNIRSKELFMRWTEMGAFTPMMRSHEGNRPGENFQVYDDDEAIAHLAKMTKVYVTLAPYLRGLVELNADKGIPVQRPIFMHYEEDQYAYDIKYEYLYGSDILVAPVYEQDRKEWEVYLPEDIWIHFWTGKEFTGGHHTVEAPLGYPPVFYRKDSVYKELFEQVKNI